MLERYTDWILKHRKLTVVITSMLVILAALGLAKLRHSSDFRAYFGPDNPELMAFEDLENTFSKQQGIFFYLEAKDGNILSKRGLQLIEELTEAGWELPYSGRVISLQNYQHTEVHEDDLNTDALFSNAKTLSPEQISRVRDIIFNEPTLKRRLISDKGHVSAVAVSMHLPEHDPTNEHAKKGVAATRALRDEFKAKYPDFVIQIGGTLVTNVGMGEAIMGDMKVLVALSYVFMITIMLVLLRSLSGMLVTLTIISFSVLSAMGLFSWFGLVMTPPTGSVPSAIMAVAVADTIHILVSYYYELNNGKDKINAIKEAIRINFSPVFITSITTIAGVLTLNLSDSPPYHDMGNMIALGVFFAWLYTITFLPALLALLPIPKRRNDITQLPYIEHFGEWVIKHHKALFVGMGVVLVLAGWQVKNNILTERWHEFFPPEQEARSTLEKTNDSLGGLHSIFFIMDSGEPNGINNPAYLKRLDEFAQWALAQPKVTSVDSFSDIVKRLNKNMNGDDPAFYTVPDSQALAAQYLLMYEMSLPMGLGLDDVINNDRSATRFAIVFEKSDSAQILALEEKANAWLKTNAPEIQTAGGTGLDVVFAHLAFRNAFSMIEGTLIALVVISIMLIFALKSVKAGLISLIPNFIPAVLAYGIWGMYKGEIDTALSIVVCLSLGIVVDDTVHFLSKYLRARNEKGLSVEDSIRYSFKTVGNALVVTSLVLIGGFSVMLFSHFLPSIAMGKLLAITILAALIVDFIFLAPLLILFDKSKTKTGA